ncbi:unnamed protein product [Heligmosomoides polygyrus]|uniref:Uncharacterized protein n=1 Tax=Heligmosomoides polygyrus TaxID=6339 RepID=A0A183F3Y5_HELPZ|nr:unnamed protein product [Heligmosomoides polygyrus]
MRRCLRLLSSWKFLPNRDRILFKDRKEALREFWRISGASLIFHIGFACLLFREFAFPTPDIVYDIKRRISPDFDLYCRFGEKAEFHLDLSNKVRMFKKGEQIIEKDKETRQSPEARFGGAV